MGIVDGQGRGATFTGGECFDWAGGRTGDCYAAQGNILTGADVVDALRTPSARTAVAAGAPAAA